ncbi:glutamine synthetase [Chytriomyces confervae]|uniref:Glutamine synthetase n=1 Tax=Chytriomyces confervae TaxID=246404 RepID=A0A507ELC4_9FUNG|nr:hypothetical protein HDU80_008295 [Chytriomyces hyalinus]TPX64883.1 glutamine synthetase [Chytriomyces confervae]
MDTDARFVRVVLTDTVNVNRVRVVPMLRFRHQVLTNGLGLTPALLGLPPQFDAVYSGAPVGEVTMLPDPSTIRILPHRKTHALILADLLLPKETHKTTTQAFPLDRHVFPLDPRALLKHAIYMLEQEFGLCVKAGFESEFILLEKDAKTPVDNDVYADMNTFRNHRVAETLDSMVESIQDMDIVVEHFHPESASGQYEIVTGYTDLLRAVDDLVMTRIVIKEVAQQVGGFHATFAPKVFADQAGTASHVHLSLWDVSSSSGNGKGGGHNAYCDALTLPSSFDAVKDVMTGNVTVGMHQFMAGVLQNLPALMALTAPTTMSFERIKPSYWSGAYQIWGVQNREAPLRVSHDGSHFEYKPLDGTANPYIALAGILFAGMAGMRDEAKLSLPVQVDPHTLSNEKRSELQIMRLPERVQQAQRLLKENAVLRSGFGDAMLDNFLAVRGKEAEYFDGLDAEEVRKLMIARY